VKCGLLTRDKLISPAVYMKGKNKVSYGPNACMTTGMNVVKNFARVGKRDKRTIIVGGKSS
jgi:hypothetical protein